MAFFKTKRPRFVTVDDNGDVFFWRSYDAAEEFVRMVGGYVVDIPSRVEVEDTE